MVNDSYYPIKNEYFPINSMVIFLYGYVSHNQMVMVNNGWLTIVNDCW
jgi:hypothetical protein